MASFIASERLISRGDKILVAISGGPDSVFLLLVLLYLARRYDLGLVAAHVNYGWRGKDSERDEKFVRAMCAEKKVSLRVKKVRMSKPAKGLEERARQIRYEYFENVCKRLNLDKVAVGHQEDDLLETVLMHVVRGAGLRGLVGVKSKNGNIRRPLLGVSRREIEKYLTKEKIKYRIDKSNFSERYLRNLLRHRVVIKLNKDERRDLLRFRGLAVRIYDSYQKGAAAYYKNTIKRDEFLVADFRELSPLLQTEFLRFAVEKKMGDLRDVSRGEIEDLRDFILSDSGGKKTVAKRLTFQKSYDKISIVKSYRTRDFSEMVFEFENDVLQGEGFELCRKKMSGYRGEYKTNQVLIDADKCPKPWRVRYWRPGDRFQPVGMRGTKKLQDYFTDIKLEKDLRRKTPLVVDANDRIIWVVGRRSDARKVATTNSKNVWRLTYKRPIFD